MLGLAMAIKRADRPLTFTYVAKNIDGAINDFISDEYKKRNINLCLPDDYDVPNYEEPVDELIPLMVDAMKQVDPLPRSIIHMSYHMNMSATDIGKTFGISLSYVSKLKRRGLTQLKKIMKHNKVRSNYEHI
jgi:RNA polymerase sigma factor (sigma-70 family)